MARLVTFDEGRVGRVEGDEIVVLDAPTMREWFERGGAAETGERVPFEGARLRPPIVPKKFFHTAGNFREHEEESTQVGWSHKIAPWIVFFQNVDALVQRRVRTHPVRRPDRELRNVDRADGRGARREPRDRRVGEDGRHLRARRAENLLVKLVTYDDGKVGRIDGDEVVRLDVATMREWFERGGADDTPERSALADVKLSAPIVPKKLFHTAGNFREHEDESKNVDWSHQIAPWINFFQNVDAISARTSPSSTRSI